MRTVKYVNKQTSAKTQYRKCSSEDLRWILAQCQRIVEVAELNIQDVINLNTSRPDLPRQGTGKRNTCHTLCQGIIDNFRESQYDLTARQCDGIERVFRTAFNIIDDFDTVEFVEVNDLPKIRVIEQPVCRTTFSDLFEIELTIRIDSRV